MLNQLQYKINHFSKPIFHLNRVNNNNNSSWSSSSSRISNSSSSSKCNYQKVIVGINKESINKKPNNKKDQTKKNKNNLWYYYRTC